MDNSQKDDSVIYLNCRQHRFCQFQEIFYYISDCRDEIRAVALTTHQMVFIESQAAAKAEGKGKEKQHKMLINNNDDDSKWALTLTVYSVSFVNLHHIYTYLILSVFLQEEMKRRNIKTWNCYVAKISEDSHFPLANFISSIFTVIPQLQTVIYLV
ncbi:CLUMA_CG014696, isoform A [Clunio marinus]|uniref:CLUMA_CG014696, isoform A n=1 Tax=Clunio marinus TaxID=568069 RepID=A0A1J1IMV0_9DIPT|nr:CLUMA_CG014696, isoform A [Clunio marinus]